MPRDLGQGLNSITGDTSANLILDVGQCFESLDLAVFRGTGSLTTASLNARRVGATRGGASFDTGKSLRFLEVDGRRYPTKGLSRIDEYEPSISMSILEQTEANVQSILGNTDLAEYANYNEYTLSLDVKVDDYIDNLAIVTALSNIHTLIVIALENALSVESIEFPLEDKNEVVTEARYVGHAPDTDPSASPFHLFYPKGAIAS